MSVQSSSKDCKILTSPVRAASTTFFLNHSTGPSTVVCRNLNYRFILILTDLIEIEINLSSGVKLLWSNPCFKGEYSQHYVSPQMTYLRWIGHYMDAKLCLHNTVEIGNVIFVNVSVCFSTWRRAQGRGGWCPTEGPPHLQLPLLPLQNKHKSWVWSENNSVWEEEWDTDNMSRISHGGSPGWAPFLPSIGCPSSWLSSYWSRQNIGCISLVSHFWTLDFYWFCTIWMKRYCGKQVNVLKYFRAGRNHQNPRAICSPSASAMCNRHWISHPMVAPISNLTTVLHPEKKTKTQMLP